MWLALSWLAGCTGTGASPAAAELVFVRDAVIAPATGAGRALSGDRELVAREWSPGERVALGGASGVAPARAECVPLFSVPLGDVSRLAALGAEPPDTAMAFSPDGERLAIGAYTGELVVADAWTGREIARRTLPEALVKAVAWSPDGRTLYAAEQSPDALLHAVDPATLADRWTVALSDDVGRSAPPAGDDLYGVYQLPGVFGLHVLPDGDLVVSAVHGWLDDAGRRHNRSRVLRIGPDGARERGWPAEGAADATLFHPRLDRDTGRIVVPVGRSADGPAPDLPIDGLLLLDPGALEPAGTYRTEPLRPYFSRAFVWEAADVGGGVVLMGLGDGRVILFDEKARESVLTLDLGTPVLAGEVPISASIGHAAFVDGGFVTITSETNIPYGAADPSLRPPAAHPNANALWAHTLDGALSWTWRGPHVLQGLTVAPDREWLVVGAGERVSDERTDLFGALVFRVSGDGSGDERLLASCATEGPIFFRQALAADGRIAVSEHPRADGRGGVTGAYRVTVLR